MLKLALTNNQVGFPGTKKNPLSVDLVKTYCATGTCTDEQVKLLVQVQNQMNEASGNNAMIVAGGMTAAAMVAAVPALAGLAPEALALALANPAAAVNAGIITAETAAAIATNSITPGVIVEGAAPRADALGDAIQFGRVENQVSHTFRHVEAAGFDRQVVQNAIQKDLLRVTASLPQGQYTGSVIVDGVKLDYSAFKLPDGTINVGRITPPPRKN
ncbi:hypothetical protein [Paraburkholderia rhizosphaerae]|uniref:hypothetical protein n=1 Tax=Paraburkholderia rhizosphaerae TaxID=480658 RepID=UPI001AB03D37|nr:hypothetical protein [Paraburkholderia rhizosphaerae]